jgi:hypothetical protein
VPRAGEGCRAGALIEAAKRIALKLEHTQLMLVAGDCPWTLWTPWTWTSSALEDVHMSSVQNTDPDCSVLSRIEGSVFRLVHSLSCHSACNIDPLSRGIGVQN